MAISQKATGAWVENTVAAPTVTLVGSPADGDRYYIWASWKPFGTTASMPAAWTEVTEYTDGAVAGGAGTGSMKVACWYRDWVSGDANPVVTFSTATGLISQVVCQLWSKGATENWEVPRFQTAPWPVTSATQTIAGTSGAINIADGSVVMCTIGLRDDSAEFTRVTTAIDRASGGTPTWNGDHVESPATHVASGTGNDMSCDLGHRFVTTGAAAVVLNATATISAVETGAILWVHQSVSNGPVFASAGAILAGSSSTTANFAVPPNVAANDTILIFMFHQLAETVTPSTGFAPVQGSPVASGGSVYNWRVYEKRATGADTGTYNFTIASGLLWRTGVALRFRGCTTTGTVVDSDTDSSTANSTATTAVSITTTAPNRLIVWSCGMFTDGTCTQPSGYTELVENAVNGPFNVSALAQAATGSTGSLSGTWTAAHWNTVWLGALMGPAAAAAPARVINNELSVAVRRAGFY